jgi:pimeloyl-ACP methyl ester carboxylesterase
LWGTNRLADFSGASLENRHPPSLEDPLPAPRTPRFRLPAFVAGLIGSLALAVALALVPVIGAIASDPPPHTTGFEPGPCPFEAEAEVLAGIDCGHVTVPENWDDPGGRSIAIPVAVLRATAPDPRPDALLRLGGGPSPALHNAPAVAAGPLRRDRDQVLFDYRGMGFGEWVCPDLGPDYLRAMSRPLTAAESQAERGRVAASCRAWAEQNGAELGAYNARSMARDAIAVTEALGYREWNILSISFGTLVTQEIMRRRPPGLRAVAMLGPVPPGAEALEFNGFAQALELMTAYCTRDEACAAAFPDPVAEYTALYDALEREPLRIPGLPAELVPEDGFYLTGSVLQMLVHQMLYSRTRLADVPMMVRATAAADFAPVAAITAQQALRTEQLTGANWAAHCDGSGAWAALDLPPEPHPALEDAFRIELRSRCARLGVEPAPADSRVAVESDIPALILVGEHDPVTPPAFARAIAGGLRNATLIEIPGRGHEAQGSCAVPLFLAFFDDPTRAQDGSCFQELPDVPFALPPMTEVPE